MTRRDHPNEVPAAGVSRREALARLGGTLAAVGGSAWAIRHFYDPRGDAGLPTYEGARLRNYFASVFDNFAPSDPRISVARGRATGDEVSPEMIRKMLHTALGPMGGIERFVQRGDVVLIKPNVAFDRGPRMGATTNPDVLGEVVRLCKGAGARRVLVADNPIEKAEPCFAKSKIREAAERSGAEVILPAATTFAPVAIRPGEPDPTRNEALGTWEVFYRPLQLADKVIGLPPIKDHNLCFASMSIKNWYGLLCGRRNQFHQAIHDIVSDLGMMISPTLVLVDGTRVLMKNGPTGGRLEDVTIGGVDGRPCIVASVDPLASDAWCLRHLLGRDPGLLRYLELAEQKIAARIESWRSRSGNEATPNQIDGKRFAMRDWSAYERQGLIRESSVV
ncbi:MAG: DUF362 domain-containing protein [Phycisphaerae bacterium]|nr:DUF362 domain-containing protein [Phycisphaerae bacterium]